MRLVDRYERPLHDLRISVRIGAIFDARTACQESTLVLSTLSLNAVNF